MIKKILGIFLVLLLLINLFYFAIGKLELFVFWFNLFFLGGISYWFFKDKK